MSRSIFSIFLVGLISSGCGLRVTNERPTFSELDPPEQDVVKMVVAELTAFNKEVKRLTKYDITRIVDREKVNVSFENHIFSGNFGDELPVVHRWGYAYKVPDTGREFLAQNLAPDQIKSGG